MNAMKTAKNDSGKIVAMPDCNCPPECTETVYLTEKSHATLRSDSTAFDKLRHHFLNRQITEAEINATRSVMG